MKYVCSVEIYQSLARVIVLFNNPDNLLKWMPNLVNMELVNCDPSDVGAITKLSLKTKTLDFEVVETITKKNLPVQFTRIYKMRDITIETNDSFVNAGDKIIYSSKNEVSFSGLMLIVGWAMGWVFRQRTRKQMRHFKHFAENYVELIN